MRKGGFLGASALAGIVGRNALKWLVPKAISWASKKTTKKKTKGKGLYMHGAKAKCGKGVALHGGRGLYLHGGKGIKQVVSKIKNSELVKGLVKKAKAEGKRHLLYAAQNPQKAYQNVKKVFKGEGVKNKMKNLTVKQRDMPKQRTGIASNQQGGTTSRTITKKFGPNKTPLQATSMKLLRKNLVL